MARFTHKTATPTTYLKKFGAEGPMDYKPEMLTSIKYLKGLVNKKLAKLHKEMELTGIDIKSPAETSLNLELTKNLKSREQFGDTFTNRLKEISIYRNFLYESETSSAEGMQNYYNNVLEQLTKRGIDINAENKMHVQKFFDTLTRLYEEYGGKEQLNNQLDISTLSSSQLQQNIFNTIVNNPDRTIEDLTDIMQKQIDMAQKRESPWESFYDSSSMESIFTTFKPNK